MTTLLAFAASLMFCEGESIKVSPKVDLNEIPVETMKYSLNWTPLFERSTLSKEEKVAKAMGLVETGGKARKGASGEAKTIWQWLPETWELISSK